MPDMYDNVGIADSAQSRGEGVEVQLKINHGDPGLGVSSNIQMPKSVAPISVPQMPTAQTSATATAQAQTQTLAPAILRAEAAPLKPPYSQGIPGVPANQSHKRMPALLEKAPFNIPETRVPATEYVTLSPARIPRPVPHVTEKPLPRPNNFSQPPVMTGQAIGPIIRKRPPPREQQKVMQPLSIPPAVARAAQNDSSSPHPQTPAIVPVSPLVASVQAQPAVRVQTPVQAPMMPTATEIPSPELLPGSTILAAPQSVSSAATALGAAPAETSAPAVSITGVVQTASPAYTTPIMSYSENTRTVWHVRRSGKTLSIVFVCGLAVVLVGLFVYWRSIGSPTNVQEIPLLHLK